MSKGAPLGNKFWELRSKHGRDKLFASPELLWEAACEYFQWIEDNPLYEVDFKGKDAEKVLIPHTRPYTYQGLSLYFDANTLYFSQFESALIGKKDDISKGFSIICARIRDTIYRQKFEGASCGFYNPLVISRDLGLTEKIESKNTNINPEPVTFVITNTPRKLRRTELEDSENGN